MNRNRKITKISTIFTKSQKLNFTKMSIVFYDMRGSPNCVIVNIVGKALGINFDVKYIDWLAQEFLKPEFVKVYGRMW